VPEANLVVTLPRQRERFWQCSRSGKGSNHDRRQEGGPEYHRVPEHRHARTRQPDTSDRGGACSSRSFRYVSHLARVQRGDCRHWRGSAPLLRGRPAAPRSARSSHAVGGACTYCRPRAADIVEDHQSVREGGDIEAIKRHYPDVLTIQDLHADNADLSFNELQLSLLAGSERFVSVLGGGAYLASYFGGTNVVYARRGWEVSCDAFDNWFHRFSGARVVAAASARELLGAVERELL